MFGRRRQTVKQLNDLVRLLEQALDKVSEHRVQVKVEHLHVQTVSLDELVFRLDKLNIDELSGSLNLGNNFGTDHIRAQKFKTQGTESRGTSFGDYLARDATRVAANDVPTVPVGDGGNMRFTDRGYQVKFAEGEGSH